MRYRQTLSAIALTCLVSNLLAREVSVSNVTLSNLTSTTVDISYTLSRATPTISSEQPIWIFVKYSHDAGQSWMDMDNLILSDDWSSGGAVGVSTVNQNQTGDIGLITSAGAKTITWTWSAGGTGLASTDLVRVRVYAVEMCSVEADAAFAMGGDSGDGAITSGTATLSSGFYLMKYPITNRMYVDFLNEVANAHDNTADATHDYWNETQSDNTRGGVDITGSVPTATWNTTSGREDWPVIGVNWLNAYDLTRWMGLTPPTEEQWEKACRSVGGASGNTYSWGDNPVPSTNLCDMSGTFSPGAPCDVNYFENVWADSGLANPYSLFEMTGNVWEWTDTESYSGAYNPSKSGLIYASPPTYVINRGGSWGVSGTYLYGSARALTAGFGSRTTWIGIRGVKN